jgi:hypothetical protein
MRIQLFAFSISVSAISLLGGCAPQLAVEIGSRGAGARDFEDESEIALADWTKCENPNTQAPTPTGPLRISKNAFLNHLYSFLNSGGAGNALPSYLRITAPSHSPFYPFWEGEGLADLFGIPEDGREKKFYTENHSLTQAHMDAFLSVAHNVASLIQADLPGPSRPVNQTAAYKLIGPCFSNPDDINCMQNFIGRAAKHLFVRLPDSGEAQVYYDFFRQSSATIYEKWGMIIRALLMHPDFIFINPTRGTRLSENPVVFRLNNFELARKIAYAVSAGPPDEILWNSAATGALTSATELRIQVQRLLNTSVTNNPNGQHNAIQHQFFKFYQDFLTPWEIGLIPVSPEDINAAASAPPIYTFNNGYISNLQIQEYNYFYNLLWNSKSFRDLHLNNEYRIAYYRNQQGITNGQSCPSGGNMIPSSNTVCQQSGCTCYSANWVPEPAYRVYNNGAEPPVQPSERNMTTKTEIIQIPTRPGILSRHTFTHNPESHFYPHIIKAGQKVKSVFACSPTPTPNFGALPSDFRTLAARHQELTLSTSQWFANTTSNPVCMSCHHGPTGMESWGRVYNEFDGFSRKHPGGMERIWTPSGTTATVPMNNSTEIYLDEKIQKVNSVAELSQLIAGSEQAHICFSRKVFTFLEARPATPQDSCTLKAMKEATSSTAMKNVIESYFLQPQFRLRRVLE